MARRYTEIAFTPAVKAAQERYGSREANTVFDRDPQDRVRLSEAEIAFISARDGFYQATVNEDGWPYVQFRGGPPGFLKVLDERTLAFADFRGNRQYISTGNLASNDRVSVILMDYARRRRLKVLGRVKVLDAGDAPQLASAVALPDYRGKVERVFVITVEAYDWNCPQHITPRFTAEELQPVIDTYEKRIAELEARLAGAAETDRA